MDTYKVRVCWLELQKKESQTKAEEMGQPRTIQ